MKDRTIETLLWMFGLFIILYCFHYSFTNQEIKCVDGDTFKYGNVWYRLAYIDTAERGEPTYVASSKFTCDYLRHNDFKLKTHGKDIYGRTLVEVNPQLEYSLNELLIKECLAIPFYGKSSDRVLRLYNNCK